jgi:hypothetical protein
MSTSNDASLVSPLVDEHSPTLIQRCLPDLNTLKEHGVTSMQLSARFIADDFADWSVDWPRFYSMNVPKKDRESLANAYIRVRGEIEDAIRSEVEDSDLEDGSFLASVHINSRDDAVGWSIDCEITALISEDWPGKVIELH